MITSRPPESAATFVRQHKNGAKAKKDNKSKITENLHKTTKNCDCNKTNKINKIGKVYKNQQEEKPNKVPRSKGLCAFCAFKNSERLKKQYPYFSTS